MIKKLSVLTLLGVSLLLTSCCKECEECKTTPPTPPNPDVNINHSTIKGSILTETNIQPNNLLKAVVGFSSPDTILPFETVGKTTIKNKKFEISLQTPEALVPVLYTTTEMAFHKIKISDASAKIISIDKFELFNGGNNLPDMGMDLLVCAKEQPVITVDTIYNSNGDVKDIWFTYKYQDKLIYTYANKDCTIHGYYTRPSTGSPDIIKVDLQLKEGWNLTELRHYDKTADFQEEFTTVNKVPEGYNFYSISDLIRRNPGVTINHNTRQLFPWEK